LGAEKNSDVKRPGTPTPKNKQKTEQDAKAQHSKKPRGKQKKNGGMGMEAEAVALFSGARCGSSSDSGFVLTYFPSEDKKVTATKCCEQ
jgi:hypothetical protein